MVIVAVAVLALILIVVGLAIYTSRMDGDREIAEARERREIHLARLSAGEAIVAVKLGEQMPYTEPMDDPPGDDDA